MIVQFDKPAAGILVVPLMQNGIVIGKKTLIPGYNDIQDKDWKLMLPALKRHIKAGYVKPVVKTVTKKAKADENSDDAPVNTFTIMMKALKALGLYKTLSNEKKEEDGKASITKPWIEARLKADSDLKDQLYEKMEELSGKGVKDLVEETVVAFKDLPAQEAIAVAEETFNLTTLEAWRKDESRDEVRAVLANQIETINKPPSKKKKRK